MIICFCGDIGIGKTSLMTAMASNLMIYSDEQLENTRELILELREQGFKKFAFPPQEHVVYSNFEIKVSSKFSCDKKSYAFDPYKFALPNNDIEFELFAPGASFFITEGQAVYNSRKSKRFRSCVSRLFENSRHNDWDIYIDAQRIMLIDLNIRDLAQRVIVPLDVVQKEDKFGFVEKTIWHYLEFKKWDDADKFLTTGKLEKCKKLKYIYEGDIFENYDSKVNRKEFYPKKNKSKYKLSYLNWANAKEISLLEPANFRE